MYVSAKNLNKWQYEGYNEIIKTPKSLVNLNFRENLAFLFNDQRSINSGRCLLIL